jgi:hypothetical protein
MTAMLDNLPGETAVLARLLAWAEAEPAIRAVLLTSSRARPEPGVDALSDYDVILAVTDPEAFLKDEAWKAAYGPPLLGWGDQTVEAGLTTYFRGVVYADFVKVDYTFWPLALLAHITASGVLTDELEAGYRVLLDKDAHTGTAPFGPSRPLRLSIRRWSKSSGGGRATWPRACGATSCCLRAGCWTTT